MTDRKSPWGPNPFEPCSDGTFKGLNTRNLPACNQTFTDAATAEPSRAEIKAMEDLFRKSRDPSLTVDQRFAGTKETLEAWKKYISAGNDPKYLPAELRDMSALKKQLLNLGNQQLDEMRIVLNTPTEPGDSQMAYQQFQYIKKIGEIGTVLKQYEMQSFDQTILRLGVNKEQFVQKLVQTLMNVSADAPKVVPPFSGGFKLGG